MTAEKTRRILMLCAVGTSLGSHLKERMSSKKKLLLSELIKKLPCNYILDEKFYQSLEESFSDVYLKDNEQILLKKLLNKQICYDDLIKKSLPSAEIQSTLGYLASEKTDFRLELYFYPSQPQPQKEDDFMSEITALYAAYYIHKLYQAGIQSVFSELSIELRPLKIIVDGPENFQESVNYLFKRYDLVRKTKTPHDKFIINMTGGYKSIASYSNLYAQIYEIPSIYTFENHNEKVFELLPLPLSYAIGAMDEEISLLRGLKNLDPKQRKQIRESGNLPRWIESLFAGDRSSHLVDMLIEQYETGRHNVTGVGMGLLDRLKKVDEPMGSYLEALISGPWSELWMGDQIPETVEHSRRHSKRLMEIAGNFYRSAENKLKEMGLADSFPLALLICAIYLHDIGHTALVYPVDPDDDKNGHFPLGKFPSSVREVHNLLSRDLIRLRQDELLPDPDDKELLPMIKRIRELVPLVCACHRSYARLSFNVKQKEKRAVWAVGNLLWGWRGFQETLEPLESQLLKLKLSEEQRIRTLEITALLRVIDGCDVQADRTVSKNYLQARLERTRYEALALEAQLRPYMDNLASVMIPIDGTYVPMSECMKVISQMANCFGTKDAIDGNLDSFARESISKVTKALYPSIFRELKKLRGNGPLNHFCGDSSLMRKFAALSLVNRIAFKWEQFLHFYKHRSVDFVLPISDGAGGIEVRLFGDKNKNNDLQSIKEDIEDEVKAVGEVLDNNFISVDICNIERQEGQF